MTMIAYYLAFIGQDILNFFACVSFSMYFYGIAKKAFSVHRIIVFSVVFLAFSSSCAYYYQSEEISTAAYGILFIAYNLLSIIFPCLAFEKGKLRRRIFFTLVLYRIALSIATQTILFSFGANLDMAEINGQIWDHCVSMILNAVWVLYCWFTLKGNHIQARRRHPIVPKRVYLLVTTTLLCIGLLQAYIYIYTFDIFPSFDRLFPRIMSTVATFGILLMIIYLLQINDSKTISENTMTLISKQMDEFVAYYETLNLYSEEFRKFQHDYKNLVLGLTAILQSRDVDQALDFISGLKSEMSVFDQYKYNSGNYIADALFFTKNQEAKKQNISIDLDGVIPSMHIENWDLCIVLTNAIDNAIEASTKIAGEKVITVSSDIKNNFWLLRVNNPVEKAVKITGDSIPTSKENSMIHGYGLSNIKRVAEKYNGALTLSCSEELFTLDVVLQLSRNITIPA